MSSFMKMLETVERKGITYEKDSKWQSPPKIVSEMVREGKAVEISREEFERAER